MQKFSTDENDSPDYEETDKILVIIDEAHRGLPEEGKYLKAAKARYYGSGHCEVLFTATPKSETLLSHGTRLLDDGSLQAFHCFTHLAHRCLGIGARTPAKMGQLRRLRNG